MIFGPKIENNWKQFGPGRTSSSKNAKNTEQNGSKFREHESSLMIFWPKFFGPKIGNKILGWSIFITPTSTRHFTITQARGLGNA